MVNGAHPTTGSRMHRAQRRLGRLGSRLGDRNCVQSPDSRLEDGGHSERDAGGSERTVLSLKHGVPTAAAQLGCHTAFRRRLTPNPANCQPPPADHSGALPETSGAFMASLGPAMEATSDGNSSGRQEIIGFGLWFCEPVEFRTVVGFLSLFFLL